MSYTNFIRGSEWRRWDLHIHTPETKKNDQFEGKTISEKWTNFIDSINSSTEDISVIGITDYFSIDNYFKFKEAIERGVITKHFDLVIPNIELRVSPVTSGAKPINLHCIFNPSIDEEITGRFLSRLKFEFSGSNFSASLEDIRRLGRTFRGDRLLSDADAAKAGYEQYVIEIGVLKEIFKSDKSLRDNTIIVVANSGTDGASGVVKHSDYLIEKGKSQLDATRYSIYQFSDAIFSSSENDVLYFSGQGADKREEVIMKCSALMPCFHGCDAHTNSKIFKPDNNRYCWIKGDPTFEGLKQTLYEPEDRVKIQSLKPDLKNERYVISQLSFQDSSDLFGNQTIRLNENLNAIIGGKSSGKSLLMYSAARAIDPEQVDRASQRLKFEGYKLPGNFDFEVKWKNGEVDRLNDSNLANKTHKITYIPQLYINHLVERNNKEDLNNLIENILQQDSEFKKFFEEKKLEIGRLSIEIQQVLTNYLQTRTRLLELQRKSKDLGKAVTISNGISSLKTSIEQGQRASNLSSEEIAAYNLLNSKKTKAEAALKSLDKKRTALKEIESEVFSLMSQLLGYKENDELPVLGGSVDRILNQLGEVPEDVQILVDDLKSNFFEVLEKFRDGLSKIDIPKEKGIINEEIQNIKGELNPFLLKVAGQQELQKLIKQLGTEEERLKEAQVLESQFKSLLSDYAIHREKIVVLMKQRYETYESIKDLVNSKRSEIGTGITLSCNVLYRQEKLSLIEQANKAAIPGDHFFYNLCTEGVIDYKKVLDLFSQPLRVDDNNRLLCDKDGINNIPLKVRVLLEDVLKGLVFDGFELDFSVTYKGDDLLSMSPGKKGTVLLILFLQISSSEFPIFIDQPEDNLDNRTIYELLCTMIKKKKKERQIIIVSHNANLVVATDAENIIVANQEGQDPSGSNASTRFAYVNGSLEHSFERNDLIPELLKQQGIKEHTCDILEGGDEAFKQRERKYSIK